MNLRSLTTAQVFELNFAGEIPLWDAISGCQRVIRDREASPSFYAGIDIRLIT